MIRQIKNLIKSGVEWLHHDYNCRLGIDNTVTLSKGLNTLLLSRKKGRYQRAYLENFTELLRENGKFDLFPRNFMRDGWAIDRSGNLPFLSELLEQTGEIIEERGVISQGDVDPDKPYFRPIYKDGDLERFPSLLDFALSSEVLATVGHQMGCVPVFSRISPPGVRLMESNEAFNTNPPGVLTESQFYHLDLHDRPVIYVIVLLTDTTEESGPWYFLPTSSSLRAVRLLGHLKRGAPYRLTDDQIYSVVDRSEVISFTGKAGDVLFIESSSCFHYGSRNSVRPRFQAMYAYTTPCRGDLKEWVWYGMRPRLAPGASRLRRMTLRGRL